MTKGNNRYGAAGKRGIPAATVVAFFDHYTYTGEPPDGIIYPEDDVRAKRISGVRLDAVTSRTIRRWRSGAVDLISPHHLVPLLAKFGFDLAWFHGWAKLHRKPITRKG